jgi:uncharacterized membrane protein YheB (UPF0754 family)
MLKEIVVNGILGGFTGYLTNKIAINMLFKEYFGFGGVIEKTKDEFVENVSNLIEKDLINHHTLMGEIEKEEFREAIYAVIKDLITVYLPKNSKNERIRDLSGFNKTRENFISFLEENKNEILLEFKNIYLDKSLSNIVSKEQFNFITLKIKNILCEEKETYEKVLLKGVKEVLSDKKIYEIISFRVLNQIENNIKSIIEDIDINEFNRNFEKYIDEILEIIDFDKILKDFEKKINSFKLKELFNYNENISKEILNRIVEILKNNQIIVFKFSEELFKALKEIDVTLYDLLDKESIILLNEFIQNKFPIFISKIISLIEENRYEIESIVNRVVKQHFSNRGFGGKIIAFIIDTFIDNISRKLGIVSKIIDKVEEFKDEAPFIIAQEIRSFLEKKTISEIVSDLEKEEIVNSKKLAELILFNLNLLEFNKNIPILDEFFEKRVEEIYKIDLSFLKDKIKKSILEEIKKEDLIKNEINKNIENLMLELKHRNVNEFFNKINFSIPCETIEEFIYSKHNILDKKISEFIDVKYIDYQRYIDNFSEKELTALYKFMFNENLYNKLTDEIIKILKLNLENILSKNVSIAVKKELNKYSPSEIKDIVEDFMGKELKPINYFGAGLGTVAGVGYYFTSISFANPILLFATPLIYAVTGVLTNHIAIEMLFKPYEEKKIGNMKIPFTPGVVAKNKPRFAKNIASFVKKDILNDDSLKNLFQTYKMPIRNLLIEKISNNDYELIDKILLQENVLDKLVKKSTELVIVLIKENREILSASLVEYIGSKNLNVYKTEIKNKIKNEILRLDYGEIVQNFVDRHSKKSLLEFSDYFFEKVDFIIDEFINKFIENLEVENIKNLLLNYEEVFEDFINTPLKSLIDDETKKNVVNSLTEKLLSFANDEIFDLMIDKLLNKESKLKELFDGKLVYLLDKNFDYLINSIIDSIKSQKRSIVNSIEIPWWAFGVDRDDIEEIADVLIYDELPYFIKNKQREIKSIIEDFLEYRVSDIGLKIDKENFKRVLMGIAGSYEFRNSLLKLSGVFVDSIMNFRIKDILEILNIRDFREFINFLEIIVLNQKELNKIKLQVVNNRDKISAVSKRYIREILTEILKRYTFSDILKNVDLRADINLLSKEILNDAYFQKILDGILDEILDKILSHDIYDKVVLKRDISLFIESSLNEENFKFLNAIFRDFYIKLNSILDSETKKEITEKIVDSFVSSLEENLILFLKAVDLEKVIETEINNMSAKEIEELFNSFAGEYFKKLKFYGLGGAVFGIPGMFI